MKMNIRKETIKQYSGYKSEDGYHVNRLMSKYICEYDSDEKPVHITFESYSADGKITNGYVVSRRWENKISICEMVDLDGNLIGYDKYNENWQHIESTHGQFSQWSYDENGKMVKEIRGEGENAIESRFEYDHNGRLIKTHTITNGKSFTRHHYYSKDFLGNIVESVIGDDGELLESNITDRLTDEVIQNKEQRIEDKTITILRYFSREGKQISCSSWRHSENVIESQQYVYLDYDGGGWSICVKPVQRTAVSEDVGSANNVNECFIDIREVEYAEDHLLGELLFSPSFFD